MLNYLEQRDLKNLGFLSKEWQSLATVLLYDRAYISPRPKDMEFLGSITIHLVICAAVKRLVYDASQIDHWQEFRYFGSLRADLTFAAARGKDRIEGFKSPNFRLNALIERLKRGQPSHRELSELDDKYKNDNFRVEDFQLEHSLGTCEEKLFRSGLFHAGLGAGLHRLNDLRSVILSNNLGVKDLHKLHMVDSSTVLVEQSVGSPLLRSGNPPHVRPSVWVDREDGYINGCDHFCDHFFTITRAVSKTLRKLLKFEVDTSQRDKSLIPYAMIVPTRINSLKLHCLNAYSNIEALSLSITVTEYDEFPFPSDTKSPLPMLPVLLKQMSEHKRLELDLLKMVRLTFAVLSKLLFWPHLSF